MVLDKKNIANEVGRWTRVGILSITTIAPLINSLATRLREEQEKRGDINTFSTIWKTEKDRAEQVEQPEKLKATSKALTDVLTQLQEHPYSQDLLKQGETLTDELKTRWSKLSRDITTHSEELSQELVKRGRTAQKELAEQDQSFWIGLGFGIGAIATAGITTYILLRKRFNNKAVVEDEDEAQTIQLPSNNGHNHAQPRKTQGEIYQVVNRSTPEATKAIIPQIQDYQNKPLVGIPANAQLVGVISTKRYYPVKTELNQSGITNGHENDLTYFASEAEAKAQGFTAAD